MIWSYGITTVERRIKDGTYQNSIESLKLAGFDSIITFQDCIKNPNHLNNWKKAFLAISEIKADRYAIFQDDILVCSRLREYLESCSFPEKGYWSLITFDFNYDGKMDRWYKSKQRGKGAQGYVFDQKAVDAVKSASQFIDYTKLRGTQRSIDGMVTMALKSKGFTEYVHMPSLLQHVSKESTLGHMHTKKFGRVKAWKEGYDPLCL